MKKSSILLASLILFFSAFGVSSLAAQDSGEYYYTNVSILKIYPHAMGYYIVYRRPASLGTAEIFVPKEWLENRPTKAVLNLTSQNVGPYVTIVTKDGAFDHVRITAPSNIRDPAWGTLTSGVPYNDKFKVDTLEIKY